MEKKVTTDLKNVYGETTAKFMRFQNAKATWQKLATDDIIEYRKQLATVCETIKDFYVDAETSGLNRNQTAELIEQSFPNLSKDARSKAVYYANNSCDIQIFLYSMDSKAISIDRMTRVYQEYLKKRPKPQKVVDIAKHEGAVEEQAILALQPIKPKEEVKTVEVKPQNGITSKVVISTNDIPADALYREHARQLTAIRVKYDKNAKNDKFTAEQLEKMLHGWKELFDYITASEKAKAGKVVDFKKAVNA